MYIRMAIWQQAAFQPSSLSPIEVTTSTRTQDDFSLSQSRRNSSEWPSRLLHCL